MVDNARSVDHYRFYAFFISAFFPIFMFLNYSLPLQNSCFNIPLDPFAIRHFRMVRIFQSYLTLYCCFSRVVEYSLLQDCNPLSEWCIISRFL